MGLYINHIEDVYVEWLGEALMLLDSIKPTTHIERARKDYAEAILRAVELDRIRPPAIWPDKCAPHALHMQFVNTANQRQVEFWVHAGRFRASEFCPNGPIMTTIWAGKKDLNEVVRRIFGALYPTGSAYSRETITSMFRGEESGA